MARTYGKAQDLIDFTRASSATYLDSDGLLKTASNNIPRIDYDAQGNVLGLLVEESRTNLITYSNDFTDASWSTTSTTITPEAATGPDSLLSASKMANNGSLAANINFASASSGNYSFSFYAKQADLQYAVCRMVVDGVIATARYAFVVDLQSGVITDTDTSGAAFPLVTKSVTDVGNGWYRISITGTHTSGNLFVDIRATSTATPTWSSSLPSEIGTTGDGIYIYNAQLEVGSFPTSLIPTSGSTATRSADVASLSTSAFGYRQDEGTIVTEAATFDFDITQAHVIADLHDGTTNNRVLTQARDLAHLSTRASGSTVVTIDAGTYVSGQYTKQASVVKAGSYACALDGGSVVTDTASSIPASATTFSLGINSANSVSLNGHIKSIKYIPRRLTNAQLQELTS